MTGARGLRLLTAKRGARPGALRAERSARRQRPVRGRQRPRARDRARARGRADRADLPGRRAPSRLALDASRVRAVIQTGHPVVGMDVDPATAARARRRRRRRRPVVRSSRRAASAGRIAGRRRGRRRSSTGGRSVVLIDDSALVTLDATTGEPRGKPVPVALPGVVEDLVPSPDGASAIALVGKPRARADLIGERGAARAGQASSRRHRRRLLPGRPARRVERDATGRAASGAPAPGSRSGSRSAATTDRCWPSRSTGRVDASRRGAPTRRPACGVPERAGRSRRSSGTPANCRRRRVRPAAACS